MRKRISFLERCVFFMCKVSCHLPIFLHLVTHLSILETVNKNRRFSYGCNVHLHWLILLLVVALVFGTSKLKNIGKDLGGAIQGFKEGMKESSDTQKNDKKDSIENK